MQFFCKEISQKVGLIINWYSFVYERNYFVSNIQFFCIFMNCICNLMALQIIAKLVQKLCMNFETFCHTNWTQNQYKSFANIFKIFLSFHMIILNHSKRFVILFKNLGFLDKISQNQCKIFVLWSKNFVFKCKKVVKNGIIWIKSKQTVKNSVVEERCWNNCHFINFKIGKRSKTRKNHLKTNSDFQRNYKVSCVFAHCCMLSFLLVLKYFLWHITVGFRLFLRDFG